MAAIKKKAPSEAEIDAEAKQVGETLKKGGMVRIKIPVDRLNESDTTVPVCVNGHLYRIKRGETVEVPEVVADILEEAGYI